MFTSFDQVKETLRKYPDGVLASEMSDVIAEVIMEWVSHSEISYVNEKRYSEEVWCGCNHPDLGAIHTIISQKNFKPFTDKISAQLVYYKEGSLVEHGIELLEGQIGSCHESFLEWLNSHYIKHNLKHEGGGE